MYWNLKQYLSYHNWGHPPTESTQRWAIMALPAYVHVLLLQVNTSLHAWSGNALNNLYIDYSHN